MKRKHLLWAAPLALALIFATLLLWLPAFVAAPQHRAAVEAFASRLTGRNVHIGGKLSLSYWPRPEIRASGITITGPHKETITAHALALDLAPAPLLRGQLVVRTLDLNTPTISFPWPLPGGISAVAPPPWLAALHAHIDNGLIRFGAVTFTKVNADLFTGPGGSVGASGSGQLAGHPATLSLAIGKTTKSGSATVSIQGQAADIKANLSGKLNAKSELVGALSLQLPGKGTGMAQIKATASSLTASRLRLDMAPTTMTGSANLSFSPPALTADLTASNVDFSSFSRLRAIWLANLPIQMDLTATHVLLDGKAYPSLQLALRNGADGCVIKNLRLGLPGGGRLGADLSIAPDTSLSGHVALSAPNLAALASGLSLPAQRAWASAYLQAEIAGHLSSPILKSLSGTLGRDHVNGQINLSPGHAAFRLAFNNIELAPLAAWLGQHPLAKNFVAAGELSATHAQAGPIELSNLFVDAALDGSLNIRRATASLAGGIVGGSVTLSNSFKVTAAHAFLDLPSAASLASLLPASVQLPAGLWRHPLSLLLAAAGPPNALAASATAKLGDFTITAAPVVNLVKLSASGAISLRHPNAITALKLLGFSQGCASMAPLPGYPFHGGGEPCLAKANDPALGFPGPGALSLRARFTAAKDRYALNDFVLNIGLLNASGQLLETNGRIKGRVDAGTLALPPLPASLQIPSHLPLSGAITIKADRVLYAGLPVAGPGTATLSLAPDHARLAIATIRLGSGTVSGDASLQLSSNAPPAASARLVAQNIDVSTLTPTKSFPFWLSQGQINATASLTAKGYTAKAMAATLGGSATFTVNKGTLSGLSLPALTAAMRKAGRVSLYKPLISGSTPFATLTIAGTLSKGNCTLTQALLTAPSGTITASGDIDLFDSTLALKLSTAPALKPPVKITTHLIGNWNKPHRYDDLRSAYRWRATHK